MSKSLVPKSFDYETNNGRLFTCKQCGECCIRYNGTLSATGNDIARWKREGRDDILKYVDIYDFGDFEAGDLWFNFNRKDYAELARCPFLRKVTNKNQYRIKSHEDIKNF